MSYPSKLSNVPSCVVPGVLPALTELHESVSTQYCGELDSERRVFEQYIHAVFKQNFGAKLQSFYPNLLAFNTGNQTRGVVGYRDGMVQPLFSEQYLDSPAETVIGMHLRQNVERHELVEVGNLALAGRGEVRWVIAAMTVFLYAAGYRWVIFTAVKPLFNAFHRLGLRPAQIAIPDPHRLPDSGNQWGNYYQACPVVCAGDITAGYRKLITFISQRQPLLNALLQETFSLGLSTRFGYAGDFDKVG